MIPTVISEVNGNPAISDMGISQSMGNMEGKEVRFGSAASAYWSIATTVISTGSINSMHDSFMPLQWNESIAWDDGQLLLRWCWRWIPEFLHFYHSRRFHQWIDGRKNTGIPR